MEVLKTEIAALKLQAQKNNETIEKLQNQYREKVIKLSSFYKKHHDMYYKKDQYPIDFYHNLRKEQLCADCNKQTRGFICFECLKKFILFSKQRYVIIRLTATPFIMEVLRKHNIKKESFNVFTYIRVVLGCQSKIVKAIESVEVNPTLIGLIRWESIPLK